MARKLSKKTRKVKKIVKTAKLSKSNSTPKNDASNKLQIDLPNVKYTEAVGRRKVATARVRLYHEASSDFIVNGIAAGKYFDSVVGAPTRYNKPLKLTGTQGKYFISAQVSGSGVSAQLDAVAHGLSRALVEIDPEFRSILKAEGLLTRDDRMKETRKIGTGGKARRKRQSPKR